MLVSSSTGRLEVELVVADPQGADRPECIVPQAEAIIVCAPLTIYPETTSLCTAEETY